ncbi:hypothetical protein [Kitasatospora sp. CB01950]|uniref:hypothetical protein n=1 Tax=Kitasatospora sp. CB01950 TaxID=1703930 RepID=UPI0009F95DBC|nr:hypothetical protein [Kitasatospora sp. CB01950]
MRRRVIRTASAGLLAAAVMAGLAPSAQAADPVPPTPKCQVPVDPWPGGSYLYRGTEMRAGGSTLVGQDNKSVLMMEADGNLVLYLVNSTGGPKHEIWSSGTSGHPGAYAILQADSNLVVYAAGGSAETGGALWSSNTYGQHGGVLTLYPGGSLQLVTNEKGWGTSTYEAPSAFCPNIPRSPGLITPGGWAQSDSVWLLLQQDGNLVIFRKKDNKEIWASGTWGHGGAMLCMQEDGNLVLYKPAPKLVDSIWSTGTFWSPGAYALLQDDGNFVIYKRAGGPGKGGAIWSTGTYGQ